MVRTRSFIDCIKELFHAGYSHNEIAEIKEISIEEVMDITNGMLQKSKTKTVELFGHKNEPYYETEEEMLNPSIYTFESLSPSEKLIYESRTIEQAVLQKTTENS